jgi:hypothetical protein
MFKYYCTRHAPIHIYSYEVKAEFVNIVVVIFTFNLFITMSSLFKQALLLLLGLKTHILANPNLGIFAHTPEKGG